MGSSDQSKGTRAFQAPKGTRDLYPQELLRKRYIEKAWRDTAIRHGFEEVDGPTFEYADLYAVKSGEGILNEVFGVFSGKDEEQRAGGGRAPYALRPEFTPTLARMYAAKAGSLPKPTKWFWQQNCFRAERPQRGRLREFGQWNVDLIGGEDTAEARAAADAEVIGTAAGCFEMLGLGPKDLRIQVSSRIVIQKVLERCGLPVERTDEALALLDKRAKLPPAEFAAGAEAIGLRVREFDERTRDPMAAAAEDPAFGSLWRTIAASHLSEWCEADFGIARGLAYYTGMVFEVHEASGAERAVAGGGRYDGLIELFGGPATPAAGFGMGDVVLSLVLQDRGLMPEGRALLEKLSAPGASLRPDVFVLSNGQPEAEAQVRPLVARLRRGEGSTGGTPVPPLHARHSYKATKNIGKLLQEAGSAHARFAAIVESAGEATLKNLETQEQARVGLGEVGARVAGR